ncbi:GNAT family N-acetyltransferase [Mucilaginibacter sp. AW1-3]
MQPIIRQATIADMQAILDIYNDAIINTTAVYQYQTHTLAMRLEWFEDKVKKDIPVWVAVINGHITGFASYGPFRAWQAYKYTIEHSVYVHPRYRRQGIAKKLLQVLIDYVATKQIHSIIAGIDADNAGSINLHLQFGFEETAHFKQVGYKFGKWLDLKFFQLILPNDLQPHDD